MAAIKTTSIINDQLLPSRKSVDVSKKDEGNATRSHAVQNEIRVTFSLVHGNSSIDGILKESLKFFNFGVFRSKYLLSWINSATHFSHLLGCELACVCRYIAHLAHTERGGGASLDNFAHGESVEA